MDTRKIGSLEVSLAGLGCNQFGTRLGPDESKAVVDVALESGITHFDTSDAYGDSRSEEYLGNALGDRRTGVVITTKFGARRPPDGIRPSSPQWVSRACEASLKRLRTDYIDLYLVHHPDPKTPIADTLGALVQLVTEGKVREIGCSNFSVEMLDEADVASQALGAVRFVNLQDNYSLLDRTPELELLPACERLGMSFVPYFPLASGMLTGKYRRGEPPPKVSRIADTGHRFPDIFTEDCFDVVESLEMFAKSHGHSLHELALSWLASNEIIPSVIAGATTTQQVRSNAAATTAWQLDPNDLAEIDALTFIDRSFTVPVELKGGLLHRD